MVGSPTPISWPGGKGNWIGRGFNTGTEGFASWLRDWGTVESHSCHLCFCKPNWTPLNSLIQLFYARVTFTTWLCCKPSSTMQPVIDHGLSYWGHGCTHVCSFPLPSCIQTHDTVQTIWWRYFSVCMELWCDTVVIVETKNLDKLYWSS